MKHRWLFVAAFSAAFLLLGALAAEARDRRVSFGFSFGYGGGYYGPHAYFSYHSGHVYRPYRPYYYYGSYRYVPYRYVPYRHRVYVSPQPYYIQRVVPRYRQGQRYDRYTPRWYKDRRGHK